MAKVTVMFGAEPQSEHGLDKDQVRVGRAPDCDIVIDNLGVSRHHCTLVRDEQGWMVVDAGSNNGTYIGGQRIQQHRLRHGDRIVLGKHSLVFDQHGFVTSSIAATTKKPAAPAGGEMTMFVDQAQLAKVLASEGQRRMALAVQQGEREVVVPLLKEELTIGSGEQADIPARGFLVKPVQAKLVRTASGHRLLALGGWRSVRVNGRKVAGDIALQPGDVIEIAGNRYTYRQA
ncbi:MAG: FHA domain-containing protein [Planctomycetota bacterium]|nr:FHA domain-containing protein [Planctomycetota bacterium]MCX8040029.1 FHA domain-containing protein [Planctomycetota bacterium]MDW8372599.1 FHA domain-containing protein [Planctomycetota bacterium]